MIYQVIVSLTMLSTAGFSALLVVDLPRIDGSSVARAISMAVGVLCLALSFWLGLRPGLYLDLPGWLTVPGWLMMFVGLLMLIYSVFIEIPMKLAREVEPISSSAGMRYTVTTGTYALCRHPGFWWLVLLVTGSVFVFNHLNILALAFVWILLDLLLIILQDTIMFPPIFRWL